MPRGERLCRVSGLLSRTLLVGAMGLMLGCGQGPAEPPPVTGPELLPQFKPGPAPLSSDGFQVLLPPVKDLMPGQSYEMCTWTEHILDQDVEVKSTESWQTEVGHHVILFYTTKHQPVGTTRLCTDDDMATFRFAVGSGAEG